MSKISRRDFLNGVLITAGATLTMRGTLAMGEAVGAPAWARLTVGDDWYGYGGVGDYAGSHGNTPTVVSHAHSLRDGFWDVEPPGLVDLDEEYDVVIVGAGMAGLGAALEMHDSHPGKRVLILDNHPVFGGEAKQNEFEVDGIRLLAPQGANGFHVPEPFVNEENDDEVLNAYNGDSYYYSRLKVPREFSYAPLTGTEKDIRCCNDHYQFLYNWFDWFDQAHVFHERVNGVPPGTKKVIEINSWKNKFSDAPIDPDFRRELLEVITTKKRPYEGDDFLEWLDSMTYKSYLELELGYSSRVTDYFSPVMASAIGLGADVVSALGAYNAGLPGFDGYTDFSTILKGFVRHSFPGGNSGFARYMLKEIIPDGIEGGRDFDDIINGNIDFDALDRAGQSIRMRLSATVTNVHHIGKSGNGKVSVTYAKGDKSYRINANTVVMAGGGWMNKHVVRDLGQEWRDAYESFHHAPFLVANIAVKNWRFMEKMGVSCVRYPQTEDSFGFCCNIRTPMTTESYKPPHDPDQPAVLTFYVPFNSPSGSGDLRAQAILGRSRLFTTSFAEYERQIRQQMMELFEEFGFDADRDIDAIILNRWGHAYVVPQPGFYTGTGGNPPARDVIRRRFGRIAFAHSELEGNQHYGPAAAEGRRAIQQLAPLFAAE